MSLDFSVPRQPQRPSDPYRRLTLVLVILVFIMLGIQWLPGLMRRSLPPAEPRAITPRGDLAADEQTTIELFESVSPSVVYITSITVQRSLFNFRAMEVPKGTGSGFLWDDQGTVVTNYHVIEGAQRAHVTLYDQTTWPAELVGVEMDKDLAVLRIKAPKESLTAIPVGTSADLQVGQKVFAIGNPFGLDHTLTMGIISALGREIQAVNGRTIQGVIQTDAAINPGNSGGPLLDSAGRLVGINTAIYSPSGAYAGIGFAVPVDLVNRIVPQIIRYGKALKPGLGVGIVPDYTTLRRLRLKGVLVANVPEGSLAEQAGFKGTYYNQNGRLVLGDLIVAVDSQPVQTTEQLYQLLESYQIGDTVKVTVERPSGYYEIEIELQAL